MLPHLLVLFQCSPSLKRIAQPIVCASACKPVFATSDLLTMAETIVLITGANQGLGYEVVKKLAAENKSFKIILGSRDQAKGEKAVSEVSNLASNTSVDTVQIDVTSDESVEKAVKTIDEKYGRIDVLFNNAGIAQSKGTVREQMHASKDEDIPSGRVFADKYSL